MANWTEQGYDPSQHKFRKGEIVNAPNGGYPDNYFYADTLRALVIGFGNFFSNVCVIRYDEKGEPVKQIQVPLKYGPRMKSHDFRVELETGKKYYIQLPNMTYRVDSVAFASDRYAGGNENRAFYSNYFEKQGIDYIMFNKFWSDVQPVPVNVSITMEAKTEHISDANQILEQVMVRFAPDAWFDLKEFWFINKRRAIKMLCESSNIEMTTDFGEEDKREITVSFTFTLQAFLYKPIRNAAIIDQIITHCGVPDGSETFHQTIMGNYGKDNPFMDRYDLAYQFGTKIGRVSALLDDYPIRDVFDKSGTIVDTYDYRELGDITNYPGGSKLIRSVSSIGDSTSAIWTGINSTLSDFEQYATVDRVVDSNGNFKYWSVTANSDLFADDKIDPTVLSNAIDAATANPNQDLRVEDQSTIWEFKFDPGYVVKPGRMKKVLENGIYVEIPDPDYPGVFGGTIVKKYDNLFGFGDWKQDISHSMGTKDILFSDNEVLTDAPYVTSASVTNKA